MSPWDVNNLREFIQTVLKEYPTPEDRYTFSPGDDDPDADYPVGKDDLPKYRELIGEGSDIVRSIFEDESSYTISDSVQTNLAEIPYIAILDGEETGSTRYGRYVVYLFDPFEQTVHLSLGVGAQSAEKYAKRIRKAGVQPNRQKADILSWLANWYRGQCTTPAKFESGPIDLNESLKNSDSYGSGSVYHVSYTLEELPSNDEIVDDLQRLVETCKSLIETRVSNDSLDLEDQRVWHVSTGGTRWDGWQENGVASIGYELDRDAFESPPSEIPSIDDASVRRDEKDGFTYLFTEAISEGDIVIAAVRKKTNPHKMYAFGRVTDPNQHPDRGDRHESIADDSHFVGVEWADFDTWIPITLGTKIPLGLNTLRELDHSEFDHVFGTTIGHAVAGGLYSDISTASSRLSSTITETSDSTTDDTDPTDDEDEDDTTEWRLGTIDYTQPRFDLKADDIELGDQLYFDNEKQLLQEILDALRRGDHLLFVGPPGTGKSKLAKTVSEQLVGDAYEMTTATADWSTFDTIGGYRQQDTGELAFSPGLFLDRFQAPDGQPINEWLIIDEFNRAEIDKAFGSLFSVLTGDDVVLPFTEDEDNITVYGSDLEDSKIVEKHEYVVPQEWRLLATMNTFDKSSLYDLSYALSRRFAYIHVPAPDSGDIDRPLVEAYIDCWTGVDPTDREIEAVVDLWKTVQSTRPLGPAIVRDVLAAAGTDLTPGVVQYVLPQFDGLMNRTQVTLLEGLADVDLLATDRIETFGRQYFDLEDLDL